MLAEQQICQPVQSINQTWGVLQEIALLQFSMAFYQSPCPDICQQFGVFERHRWANPDKKKRKKLVQCNGNGRDDPG